MFESNNILICKVTNSWYQVLKTHFLAKGSSRMSLFQNDNTLKDAGISPGTLTLFLLNEDNKNYIIGGGYFLFFKLIDTDNYWNTQGVKCGFRSKEELQEYLKNEGYDPKNVETLIFDSYFMFTKHERVLIPENFDKEYCNKNCNILSLDDPFGKYINKIVLSKREPYIASFGMDWPGIYFATSHFNTRNYYAQFNAKISCIYNNTCALTGTKIEPLVDAVHIKPFSDHKFQDVQNGIMLRTDIHKLFNEGYITFEYKKSDLIAIVSKSIKDSFDDSYYDKYNRKKLHLPEDLNLRPKKELIDWHRENVFEYWLNHNSRIF